MGREKTHHFFSILIICVQNYNEITTLPNITAFFYSPLAPLLSPFQGGAGGVFYKFTIFTFLLFPLALTAK